MLKAKSHNSNIIKCEDKPIKRKFGIQEIGNQIQKRKGGDCPDDGRIMSQVIKVPQI